MSISTASGLTVEDIAKDTILSGMGDKVFAPPMMAKGYRRKKTSTVKSMSKKDKQARNKRNKTAKQSRRANK